MLTVVNDDLLIADLDKLEISRNQLFMITEKFKFMEIKRGNN